MSTYKPIPYPLPQKVLDGFWQFAIPGDPDTCWLWQGDCHTRNGYGKLYLGNQFYLTAHRIAYVVFYKEDPGPYYVLHSCDCPPCWNPQHLFKGTNLDNIADRTRKGRTASGVKNGAYTRPDRLRKGVLNGRSKLSEENVREIKNLLAEGKRRSKIARQFLVSWTVIDYIKIGKLWKHIQ